MLRVKSILKQKGISQKELATRIDKSPETLNRMLSNGGNPSLSTLKEIATALELPLSEIFEDSSEKPSVKGYLEINGELHRITHYNELEAIYQSIKTK